MQLVWLLLVNQFSFKDPMVSEHSVWTAVGVHKNMLVFSPIYETLCLFLCLGTKMIGKNAYYLLLTPNELHDILENAQLYFIAFIFLKLLVGHLQYLLFFLNGVAHPPMKIATHFDISIF